MPAGPPDIIAYASKHDIGYWYGHPDVMDAELCLVRGDDGQPAEQLRLWLARPTVAVDEGLIGRFGLTPPTRPRDIELFVEGAANVPFVARCPSLAHAELFQDIPDETYPRGWWVARLWIESAPAGRL
jgi:hypothetical protein